MVQGTGTKNVVPLCKQRGDPSIVLTEHERRDRLEHREEEPNGSFLLGCRRRKKVDLKHLAVIRNCVYDRHLIRSSWLFSARCINNQSVCIKFYLLAEKLP